jgi:hypothetical protein
VKKINFNRLISRGSQLSVYFILISFPSSYSSLSGNGRPRKADTISGKEMKGKKKRKKKNTRDEERVEVRDPERIEIAVDYHGELRV